MKGKKGKKGTQLFSAPGKELRPLFAPSIAITCAFAAGKFSRDNSAIGTHVKGGLGTASGSSGVAQ